MKSISILIILLIISFTYCQARQDSTFNVNNHAIGVTLGNPGGINLHYGWNAAGPIEVYLFGGGWFSGVYGLKSSIQYQIYKTGEFENNITFNFGISRNGSESESFWSGFYSIETHAPVYELSYFIGPGLSLRWDWFLFRCEVLTGNKSYKSPKLFLNLGYTYEF